LAPGVSTDPWPREASSGPKERVRRGRRRTPLRFAVIIDRFMSPGNQREHHARRGDRSFARHHDERLARGPIFT
jgi:hypothetical protein